MAESPVATPHLREEAPSPTRSAAAPEVDAPDAATEVAAQALVRALHPGAGGGAAGAPTPPPPSSWTARRSASPRDFVALQRMAGNRAVAGLVARRSTPVPAPVPALQRQPGPQVLAPPTSGPNVTQDPAAPAGPTKPEDAAPMLVTAGSMARAAKELTKFTKTLTDKKTNQPLDVVIVALESKAVEIYDGNGDHLKGPFELALPKDMWFGEGVYVTFPGGGSSMRMRMDPVRHLFRPYEDAAVLQEKSPAPLPSGSGGAPGTMTATRNDAKAPAGGAQAPAGSVQAPAGSAVEPAPAAPKLFDLRKYLKNPAGLEDLKAYEKFVQFTVVRTPLESGGTGKPGGGRRTTGFSGEVEGKGAAANRPPWPVTMDGPKMVPIGGAGTYLASINWQSNGADQLSAVTSQIGTDIHYRWEVFDITAFAKREAVKAEQKAKETRAMIQAVMKAGLMPDSDPKAADGIVVPAKAGGGAKPATTTGGTTGATATTPVPTTPVPATGATTTAGTSGGQGGDNEKSLAEEVSERTYSKSGSGEDKTGLGGANDQFQREFKTLWGDSKRAWQNVGDSRAETARERYWEDAGNVSAVALLPISALVTTLGASLRYASDFMAGERQQQEIPMKQEGTFLVRVVTTPRVDTDRDGNQIIRPSSVASRVVEVTQLDRLVTQGLAEPGARIAELETELKQLQNAPQPDQKKIDALKAQLEGARQDTGGDPSKLLWDRIQAKEKDLIAAKAKYEPLNLRGPIIEIENDIAVLRKRYELFQLQDKERIGGDGTLEPARRVNATLVSEVTGQPYPLLLSVGPMKGRKGDDGKTTQHKWKVLDATSKKAEGFEGVGTSAAQALENALRAFGKDAQYGRGIIGVQLPPTVMRQLEEGSKAEHRITSQPVGWSIAQGRIDDLVMTLVALGLLIGSGGTAAALIGAAVAAAKLWHRIQAGTFEFDVETVSDLLAVIGGVAIVGTGALKAGTQVVSGMRLQAVDKAFVLIPDAEASAEKVARASALVAKASNIYRGIELANEAFNYAGVVWGNITFLGTMADLAAQEASGAITHAEARRQRATAIGGAIQNNGMFLAGNWKQAKERAKQFAAKGAPHEGSPSASDGTDAAAPKRPVGPKEPVAPKESVTPREPESGGQHTTDDAHTKGAGPKDEAGGPRQGEITLPEGPATGHEAAPGARPGEPVPVEPAVKPAADAPKAGSPQARKAAARTIEGVATGTEPNGSVEGAIKQAGSWKESLKSAVSKLEGPDRLAAEAALVEARDTIVKETWKKVQDEAKGAYDGLRLDDSGTKSFGSDIDATIRPKQGGEATGAGADMANQIKLAGEASKAMSKALRERVGGETDVVIDTNIYSFIGEGRLQPTDPKGKAAQQQVDLVVGLAEQLRGQNEQQFKAFEARLAAKLGDPRVVAEAKALLAKAREFHNQRVQEYAAELAKAKADPANKTEAAQKRAAREELLGRKKNELSDLMNAPTPDVEAITSKQSEINWFAPDAYATPSAFKQAVAHGQRLKGTGKSAAELSAPEVAGKLREAASKLPADDPRAGKLKTDAQLVEDQGRLLESTNRELKNAQAEAPMDVGRVNDLERRAAKLREAIATPAERLMVAELLGETAPSSEPSGKRLSSSAAASGANMGFLTDHVATAKDVDGRVKAAAKYAGRIAMAEFLSGLRPGLDPISRLIADFVKGRWGIMEDASPQIMRDMFVRYARLTGKHTELTYNSRGEAVGATDALKQAFVNDVANWARDTNDGIQAAAIGSKAFENPVPATSSAPVASEPTPKPPGSGEGAAAVPKESGPGAGHAGAEESPVSGPEHPTPAAPIAITRAGGVTSPGETPTLHPPGVDGVFAFRMEMFGEASATLRRLANGDPTALSERGVQLPPGYKTQGREFGLAAMPDGTYAIIQGGEGEVHWYQLPRGAVPLMHTHPLTPGRELTKPGSVREIVSKANERASTGTTSGEIDAVHAFPSGADTVWCAVNGIANHDVASPYVHTGDGILRNPTGAANERQVSFKISDAKHVGNYGMFPVAESIITVHDTNGTILWMGKMWGADLRGGSMIRFEPIEGLLPPNPDTLPFKSIKTRAGTGGADSEGPVTRREGAGAATADENGPATRRDGAGGKPQNRGEAFGDWTPVEGLQGGAWIKDDGYGLTVRAEADPSAAVRIEGKGRSLSLTSADRRDLPKGTGSLLIAEALRVLRAGTGTELVIFGIINPETIETYKAKGAATDSLLGKSVDRGLAILGLTARAMRWEHIHDKLSIVVDVS